MKTKHKFLIIFLFILMTFVVLSAAAGDKPEELDEYNSIEIGLGLLYITSVFWAPLALVLLFMPGKTR